MRVLFWSLWMCSSLATYPEASQPTFDNLDKLGLRNNYNEIVRDVIKNWESPIMYLRSLGYLPHDYEDTSKIKPNLDALLNRIENNDQQTKEEKCQEHFSGTFDIKDTNTIKQGDSVKDNDIVKRLERKAVASDDNSYDTNYMSVDKLFALHNQQAKPLIKAKAKETEKLADSASEVDQEQQQEQSQQQANSQLLLLGHLLPKQQQEQVQQPQSETSGKFNDFLHRLVEKTGPDASADAVQQKLKIAAEQSPLTVVATAIKTPEFTAKSGFLTNQMNHNEKSSDPDAIMAKINSNSAVKSDVTAELESESGSGKTNQLSTYGTLLKSIANVVKQPFTFSRQNEAQSKDNDRPQIEAPQYLTWDIKNNKLKDISPILKDAYVDKLVRIYVKKQVDKKENLEKR